MLSPNPLKKWKAPKKSYNPELLHICSNKSKTPFFCHFFVDNFFAWFFLQLFQRIRNNHPNLRILTRTQYLYVFSSQ